MKIFDSTMCEERKIEGTPYFFQKSIDGYSLYRFGFNTAFLKGISDFLTFEEEGSKYMAFRTNDQVYSVYLIEASHLERIVTLHPGNKNPNLPHEFFLELDLGKNKENIYLLRENLKFETVIPKFTKTVKVKNKNHVSANITISVVDVKCFNSVIVNEGKSRVRYVLS